LSPSGELLSSDNPGPKTALVAPGVLGYAEGGRPSARAASWQRVSGGAACRRRLPLDSPRVVSTGRVHGRGRILWAGSIISMGSRPAAGVGAVGVVGGEVLGEAGARLAARVEFPVRGSIAGVCEFHAFPAYASSTKPRSIACISTRPSPPCMPCGQHAPPGRFRRCSCQQHLPASNEVRVLAMWERRRSAGRCC
jgi:hypothetical protein